MIARQSAILLRLACLVLVLGPACRTAPVRGPERGATGETASPSSAAAWRYQPHSWDKLNAISRWLAGTGPEETPELVPQAELELAEGRLRFAREEGGAAGPPGARELRLTGAEAGFQRVLGDPETSPLQLRRAQAGLLEVRSLRGERAMAAGLAIRKREEWGARAPIPTRLTPHSGAYRRITVHHSAKHTGVELGRGSTREVDQALRKIQTVHMRDQSWGDIGYHFLVAPDGTVLAGRSLRYQGAHSRGRNNVANIGICLFGHFDEESPSPAALRSLERLVDALSERHGIPADRVLGHRELTNTVCPGARLMRWVENYRGGLARR